MNEILVYDLAKKTIASNFSAFEAS